MSGTGVENYYSSTLLNISGSLLDRLRSAFSGEERVGSSIQLTIDGELTAYISSIFPEGKNGAVCVINYRTGEVLAWVSKPDYDPADLLRRLHRGRRHRRYRLFETAVCRASTCPGSRSRSSRSPRHRGRPQCAQSEVPLLRLVGLRGRHHRLRRRRRAWGSGSRHRLYQELLTSHSASSPTSLASSACAPRRRISASTKISSSAIL